MFDAVHTLLTASGLLLCHLSLLLLSLLLLDLFLLGRTKLGDSVTLLTLLISLLLGEFLGLLLLLGLLDLLKFSLTSSLDLLDDLRTQGLLSSNINKTDGSREESDRSLLFLLGLGELENQVESGNRLNILEVLRTVLALISEDQGIKDILRSLNCLSKLGGEKSVSNLRVLGHENVVNRKLGRISSLGKGQRVVLLTSTLHDLLVDNSKDKVGDWSVLVRDDGNLDGISRHSQTEKESQNVLNRETDQILASLELESSRQGINVLATGGISGIVGGTVDDHFDRSVSVDTGLGELGLQDLLVGINPALNGLLVGIATPEVKTNEEED